MALEQHVTRGQVVYIHALGFDAHRAHFVMTILKHPEQSALARTLLFTDVQSFTDDWDEAEPVAAGDVDSLIGLIEYPAGGGVRYLIRTEYREISFYTEAPPSIIEHS
ncbi:MAG TPA: hypothetical protein VGJ87_07820 [Roseiflexaceae bacterium]|jgi:hypothetical protein